MINILKCASLSRKWLQTIWNWIWIENHTEFNVDGGESESLLSDSGERHVVTELHVVAWECSHYAPIRVRETVQSKLPVPNLRPNASDNRVKTMLESQRGASQSDSGNLNFTECWTDFPRPYFLNAVGSSAEELPNRIFGQWQKKNIFQESQLFLSIDH